MGDQEKEKWDTEKMREHRNDWSLFADVQLLSHMQQFSQNVVSETHSTLTALDSLESEVANTTVEVSNLGNRFWALSDTQFVESRVYDDDDISSPTTESSVSIKQVEETEADIIQRLTESIQEGVQVLNRKFEAVQVPPSDSDDDDSSPQRSVLLKPVNRYKDRPLPHLIGSVEFRTDDTLGLRDPPTDEETEEFISASDKGYDNSEDSDIESEQTKVSGIMEDRDTPATIFTSVGPRSEIKPTLPKVPQLPGDMFGEEEDDLFPQPPGKKSVFANWQATDLWADDEEGHKPTEDHNQRPPSTESSISAQSSNLSEPPKKSSQDFGKSGSGRMPVSVQDDQDDLFVTSSEPPLAPAPELKKSIPAGGVKIFGADFNPFPVSSKKEVIEPSVEKLQKEDRLGSNKQLPQESSTIPDQHVSKSSAIKKVDMDLFGDEDSDDDLFSSSTNQFKSKENTSKREDSKITKDLPKKPYIPTSKDIFPSQNDDDDDLFFNKRVLFNPKPIHVSNSTDQHSKGSGSDDDDLFTGSKKGTIAKNLSATKGTDDLFSETKSTSKQFDSSKAVTSKDLGLFDQKLLSDDEEDLFANIGTSNVKGVFGTSSLLRDAVAKINQQAGNPSGTAGLSKGIFDDSDEDDLFPEVSSKILSKASVKDDSFSVSRNAETNKPPIKEQSSNFKANKTELKSSLFDSDSEEDLFASTKYQKSHTAPSTQKDTAIPGYKDPVSASTGEVQSKLPKTDLRLSNSKKNISSNTGDLLGEYEDLFPSSNSYKTSDSVKTPDLFKNTTPSIPKESVDNVQAPLKFFEENSLDSEFNEKTLDSVLDSSRNKYFGSESGSTDKTDIFDATSKITSEKSEHTKLEPPKTLDVKSIIETVHKIEEKVEHSDSIQKPPLAKKPVTEDLKEPKDFPENVRSPLKSLHENSVAGELNEKSLGLVQDTSSKRYFGSESRSTEKTNIFDEKSKITSEQSEHSKLEPPKTLDVKPLIGNVHKTKEKVEHSDNIQKPPLSKKPVTDVYSEPKDFPDGEILSPPSPAKVVPGKLKISQLININPATLLPGAKPKAKSEESPSPPKSESQTKRLSDDNLDHKSLLSSAPVVDSDSSSSRQEESMPPKGTLLQSVMKERPKIQGKRRPPSRRARQQAVRASTIEDDETTPDLPTNPSAVRSPSTDEEDLFSVPPLDTITDDLKAVSPSTDIFGPPKVLSPTKVLPSSFVSTPFVHAQPPPLEEEDDDASSQDKDLFEPQDKPEFVPQNENKTKDLFDPKEIVANTINNMDPDLIFAGLEKELPPPLVDEDDDDNSDELFMSSDKKTKHSPSLFEDHSKLLYSEPSTLPVFPNQEKKNNSLFQSDDNLFDGPDEFITISKNPKADISPDSLVPPVYIPSSKPPPGLTKSDSKRSLFTDESDLSHTSLAGDPLLNTRLVKNKEESLFSTDSEFDLDFPDSNFRVSESASDRIEPSPYQSKISSISPNIEGSAGSLSIKNPKANISSDSLVSPLFIASSKPPPSSTKDDTKRSLFWDVDDDEDLFSPRAPAKSVPKTQSKPSLFPDDDEDFDLFASGTSKKPVLPTSKLDSSAKLPQATKGERDSPKTRATKTGVAASTKPVKLQTKQALSDPLLGLDDSSN